MRHIYNDGGRSHYFKGTAGDCVVRAIAIASGIDYKSVYNELKALNKGQSCRDGTPPKVTKKWFENHGWKWHATMGIGTGCKVHMSEKELPKGIIVVRLSGHVACVKNGVLYDTYDCTRDGTRCVYGYWTR